MNLFIQDICTCNNRTMQAHLSTYYYVFKLIDVSMMQFGAFIALLLMHRKTSISLMKVLYIHIHLYICTYIYVCVLCICMYISRICIHMTMQMIPRAQGIYFDKSYVFVFIYLQRCPNI